MTKILIDRSTVEQALHVATAAGYPVALIATLRASLAEPQRRKTGKPRNATTRLGVVLFEAYARSYVGSNRWDIAAEAVRRAALAEPETCTWQQDGDSDSGVYGTSCGHYFDITDGTPEDNKMAWCCYCGRKLTQALITEDEDD